MEENICIHPVVLNMFIEKSAKASRAIVSTNSLDIPSGVVELPPIQTTSGKGIQLIIIHGQVMSRSLAGFRDEDTSRIATVGEFLSVLNVLHKVFVHGWGIPAQIFHPEITGVLKPKQLEIWLTYCMQFGDYTEFLASSSVFRGTLVENMFHIPITESFTEFHVANQLIYLTTSWLSCTCLGSVESVYRSFQAVMYSPSKTACLRVPPISESTRDVDLALHFGPQVSEEIADWLRTFKS